MVHGTMSIEAYDRMSLRVLDIAAQHYADSSPCGLWSCPSSVAATDAVTEPGRLVGVRDGAGLD